MQNKAMVDLGIPSAPPPTLHPRRKTRQLKVGAVGVGSESQVSVQSMIRVLQILALNEVQPPSPQQVIIVG